MLRTNKLKYSTFSYVLLLKNFEYNVILDYQVLKKYLLAAGNTPISCSIGLKGSVFFSNSVGMSPMLTKSLAKGA